MLMLRGGSGEVWLEVGKGRKNGDNYNKKIRNKKLNLKIECMSIHTKIFNKNTSKPNSTTY